MKHKTHTLQVIYSIKLDQSFYLSENKETVYLSFPDTGYVKNSYLFANLKYIYKCYPTQFSEQVSKMLNFLFIIRKTRFYKHPEVYSGFEKRVMSFFKSNMGANYYFLTTNVSISANKQKGTLDINVFVDSNLKNLIPEDKYLLVSNLIISYYFLLEHIIAQTKNPVVCQKLVNSSDIQLKTVFDNFAYNTVSGFHNSVKLSRKVNFLIKHFRSFGLFSDDIITYDNVSISIKLTEKPPSKPLIEGHNFFIGFAYFGFVGVQTNSLFAFLNFFTRRFLIKFN